MDLIKIGTFIAEKRKENGLTQIELAEKLHITDRAVSKWECGKSLPDVAIMQSLCKIFKITINDLLNGELIPDTDKATKAESQIVDLLSERQSRTKRINAAAWLFVAIGLIEVALIVGALFLLIPNLASIDTWRIVVLVAVILTVTGVSGEIAVLIERKYLANLKGSVILFNIV